MMFFYDAIVELNKAVKLGNYNKEAIELGGFFIPFINEAG